MFFALYATALLLGQQPESNLEKRSCIQSKTKTYHSVVADFSSAYSRLDIVVGVCVIEVLNQLAINLAHGVNLRHLVEDDLSARHHLLNGFGG